MFFPGSRQGGSQTARLNTQTFSSRWSSHPPKRHHGRPSGVPQTKRHERWTRWDAKGRRVGRGGQGRTSKTGELDYNDNPKTPRPPLPSSHLRASLVFAGDHLPAELCPPLCHADGVGRVGEDGGAAHRRVFPGRLARQDARNQACARATRPGKRYRNV